MVFGPDVMFKHFGEETVCRKIEETIASKELDIFAIMANVMDMKTGEMQRLVFLYSKKDSAFAQTFDELQEFTKNDQMLKCTNEVRGPTESVAQKFGKSQYVYWLLENKTVSRKKYEKVFRKFYE